jgi:hypothetical protein
MRSCIPALLLLCLHALPAPGSAADRAALLEGVKHIGFPGPPGPVCAFGPDAFVVVAGREGDAAAAVVAAGTLGKGRVIVFGHEGYLRTEGLKQADTLRLVTNAIRWGARAGKGQVAPAVAVVDLPGTAAVLAGQDFKAADARGASWPAAATRATAIVCPTQSIPAAAVARLRQYVEDGGALVVGTPGWGWLQLHPGKSLDVDFPGNQLLAAAANAFGGLIYITSPAKMNLGEVKATIAGAVEAPLYVRGKTSRADWLASRNAPAPWAEFASGKLVITVPRDAEARRALDVPRMQREGAWGYFHELGHNHQGRDWTFAGTVEVTCNLYSLYLTETFCPKAPFHEEMLPPAIRRNAARYRAAGAKFPTWQQEPFVALILYKQMRDAFGWETFTKVFKEYRALPSAQRPRTDAGRRDQWLERFSRACGKSLAPAFDFWGVPVSEAARQKVAHLPLWSAPDPGKAER